MRLLIPSIISKHTLLDVNGLKSDRALYKVWHIAAKLSHETNLAITKLSLSLIHNNQVHRPKACLCLLMRQPVSKFQYIFNRPLLIFACLYPHIWKSGGIIFFSLANPVLYPTLKSTASPMNTHARESILRGKIVGFLQRCNNQQTDTQRVNDFLCFWALFSG